MGQSQVRYARDCFEFGHEVAEFESDDLMFLGDHVQIEKLLTAMKRNALGSQNSVDSAGLENDLRVLVICLDAMQATAHPERS